MADLDKRLDQIRKKIQNAGKTLNNEELKKEIVDVLAGLERTEIVELAKKVRELEKTNKDPIGKNNLMSVVGHILTYYPDEKKVPESKKEIPIIPQPVDPKKNPNDVYGDDFKPKFTDEYKGTKKIRTRGQKIDSDAFDYGKEYPGSGKMESDIDTATHIIIQNKGLTTTDKDIVEKMSKKGASNDEIIKHIQLRIQEQRRDMETKKEKRKFDTLLKECFSGMQEYLEKEFGKEIADKLSLLPDPSRIHLVGEYDFLNITGSKSACGIFRSKNGDIYLSGKFLEKYDTGELLGRKVTKNMITERPRIYREIKHLLIHEGIHSMSILNYKESINAKNVDPRRIGLRHISHNLRRDRGVGINEGTTENITQRILEYIYKEKEGLAEYKPCWISYEKEQKIIETLIKENKEGLEWSDFYKGMLVRKYGDKTAIKGPTPLVQLLRKINEGKNLNTAKYPYFYEIIMDMLDYVNRKNTNDIDFIISFIKTKDLKILQNKFQSVMDAVFDKRILLNKTGTNFNDTIINAYTKEQLTLFSSKQ